MWILELEMGEALSNPHVEMVHGTSLYLNKNLAGANFGDWNIVVFQPINSTVLVYYYRFQISILLGNWAGALYLNFYEKVI
jgi:hypothetical protein